MIVSRLSRALPLGLGPAVVWPANGTRTGRTRILASAALVVMSGLVKPNFIMAFLPALGALAVINGRHTDWLARPQLRPANRRGAGVAVRHYGADAAYAAHDRRGSIPAVCNW